MADEWSEWRGWNGGECPVEPDAIVHPCCYSGVAAYPGPASEMRWSHDELGGDIIAYRVKREPRVETVRRPVRWWTDPYGPRLSEGHTNLDRSRHGFLVFETRDGIPDMTTLRWEDSE